MQGERICFENGKWRKPSTMELQNIAKENAIEVDNAECDSFTRVIRGFSSAFEKVSSLSNAIGDRPPVKYGRLQGWKPLPIENKHNAWAYKMKLIGAAAGKLKGKMVAVKDNISVADVPMTIGSNIMAGYIPEYDAVVVTRVLDAGATILGKTNCEEFCFSGGSSTCCNGPVLNPLDVTRTTGGSSSGNAAALASGDVHLAIGTDDAGSIRIPCAWCGLVGLKPTHGLIPCTGSIAVEVTMHEVGPMARTVTDCALLLEVLAGYSHFDSEQPQRMNIEYEYISKLTGSIQGKTIGLLSEGFACCDERVQDTVKSSIDVLRSAGANIRDVSCPAHSDAHLLAFVTLLEGSSALLLDQAAMPLHRSGFYDVQLHEYLRHLKNTKLNTLSPFMKMLLLYNEYAKRQYGRTVYGNAHNVVNWLKGEYDKIFSSCDVFVMPTVPTIAPLLPSKSTTIEDALKISHSCAMNTCPMNLTGHPAITINSGFIDGMPVGMLIVGKHWDEAGILNISYAVEQFQRTAQLTKPFHQEI